MKISFLQTGSFVGGKAFWIYVLIGEFVLLLICFDAILYFKQMGGIYSTTRKCRTKPANVNEDEIEENAESQTLKGINLRNILISNYAFTYGDSINV